MAFFRQLQQKFEQWMGTSSVPHSDAALHSETQDDATEESLFQSMMMKLRELQSATGQRGNAIAESLASQITLWTGKKTTAEEVKRGVKTGAILGGIMAMFLVAREMSNHCVSPPKEMNTSAHEQRMNSGMFASPYQSDEEFHEQVRIEEDHLDYVRNEQQDQYFDQMHDIGMEQMNYNDSFDPNY